MKSRINIILVFLSIFVFGCSAITKLAGGATKEVTITLYDLVKADIGGTPVEQAFMQTVFQQFAMQDSEGNTVTYTEIGDPTYDAFFKGAARLNALVNACKVMTSHTTVNLQKFAQQRAAKLQGKIDMKEISDKPMEEWTEVEHIIFMQQTKDMATLNGAQAEFLINTAATMKLASMALGKGVVQAKDLLSKGDKLLKEVKDLKPLMIPSATAGIKTSLVNLKNVATNAPKMAQELVQLATSITKINN